MLLFDAISSIGAGAKGSKRKKFKKQDYATRK